MQQRHLLEREHRNWPAMSVSSSERLFNRFRRIWDGPAIETIDPQDEINRIEQERAALAASSTEIIEMLRCPAMVAYRKRLEARIVENRPRPELGVEAVACYTMRQEGLRDALSILDEMGKKAMEVLSDEDR